MSIYKEWENESWEVLASIKLWWYGLGLSVRPFFDNSDWQFFSCGISVSLTLIFFDVGFDAHYTREKKASIEWKKRQVMADCKHEITPLIDSVAGKFRGYICINASCNNEWGENEVVILTKEQHDKREAVIGAVRRLLRFLPEDTLPLRNLRDDEDAIKRVRVHRRNVATALEAYEGDK